MIGIHLTESYTSIGAMSTCKNVYLTYEVRAANFGIHLSLLLPMLQVKKSLISKGNKMD